MNFPIDNFYNLDATASQQFEIFGSVFHHAHSGSHLKEAFQPRLLSNIYMQRISIEEILINDDSMLKDIKILCTDV